jgi:hypothetical protein
MVYCQPLCVSAAVDWSFGIVTCLVDTAKLLFHTCIFLYSSLHIHNLFSPHYACAFPRVLCCRIKHGAAKTMRLKIRKSSRATVVVPTPNCASPVTCILLITSAILSLHLRLRGIYYGLRSWIPSVRVQRPHALTSTFPLLEYLGNYREPPTPGTRPPHYHYISHDEGKYLCHYAGSSA